MEAVIICGAKSGEDEGAGCIASGELLVLEQCGEIECLAFDEEGSDFGDILEAEVAAICREGGGSFGDGAGRWIEFSVEEIVEGREFCGGFFEGCGIEFVFFDEWAYAFCGSGCRHAVAIPFRESVALYEGMKGGFAQRIAVDPAEESLAVDLFVFVNVGVSVEIFDLLHGWIESAGGYDVKERAGWMKKAGGEWRIGFR